MIYTVDTKLASNPNNSAVTLLSLGTSTGSGLVTSNALSFGSNNKITFSNTSGVYHGNKSGVTATPYGEAGNYLTAEPGSGISIDYATAQKYFGLLWGSVDAGNTIRFYNGTTLVGTVTGSDVSKNPNGFQDADGSLYANINFTDVSFTRVVLTTANPAFEFNAIAYATSVVPVTAGQSGTPATVRATDTGTGKVVGYDTAPATLSGTVFLDANADGTQAGSDAGAAGITVQLYNSSNTLVSTDVTNASGLYEFNNVAAGTYTVAVAAPSGSKFSPIVSGASGSQVNSSGSATVRATAGNTSTVNAGVYTPATVSGVAFTDNNGDGVQGSGDTALVGTTVQLLGRTGDVVATATTGSNGAYSFNGIVPGTYQVNFLASGGAVFTAQDRGGNDAIDSDVGANGRSASLNLVSGSSVSNLSAGVYTPATVSGSGDVVFIDSNANGIRDNGEAGRSGVTVRLLNTDGDVVATATTAAGGTYGFSSVAPGTYQIEFVAPLGTAFTAQDQGGNDTIDSDASVATGRTAIFTVTSGGTVNNLAAGLQILPTQLGGDVWLDANGNGVRDTGEQLLQGVPVRLLDAAGRELGPTTLTDASGHYVFDELQAGSYRVGFAPLIGTAFTAQDRGGDETLDSDARPLSGVSSLVVSLAIGTSDFRSGAGLVLSLSQTPRQAPVINLGSGNDGYPGTDTAEVVYGNGGDDAINGLGGNDTTYGQAGNDALNGHAGNDLLDGGAGNDNVQGQEGNDTLLGGSGDDIGEGGDGNDVLLAGAGNDNMQGEGGNDYLFGGSGDDILTGNQGDDVVAGGNGNDTLQGADGNDIVIGGRDSGRMSLGQDRHVTGIVMGDMLEGNGGADAFVYEPGDGVDLLLDFNPAEGDTLTIYGYTGFSVVERTEAGQMALYLGPNAGFILNNGLFQGSTAASSFEGVHFITSTADAPNNIMGRDVVVPVLAEDWVSNFHGTGQITVAQDFPPLGNLTRRNDVNGDGFSDLILHGSGGEIGFWGTDGSKVVAQASLGNPGTYWNVAGTDDFNGDGHADLVLHGNGGEIGLWETDGSRVIAQISLGNPTSYWNVAGADDFNGDGFSDIVLRGANGEIGLWETDGSKVVAQVSLGNPGAYWNVAGTGDFDADGHADLILRGASGEIGLWETDGSKVTAQVNLGNPGTYWNVAAASDFNADGHADLALRGAGGEIGLWETDGSKVIAQVSLGNPGTYWNVTGAGDFNGDGYADVALRGAGGEIGLWETDGSKVIAQVSLGNPTSYWGVIA